MTAYTASTRPGSIFSILIADEQPLTLRTLGRALDGEGYEVVLASTGEEALAALAHDKPDLALVSVVLPDTSGLDVLRRAKADQSPALFIMMSAQHSVDCAVQAMKRDLVHLEPRYLLGGALTGLMFVVSKSIEYFEKFASGITPAKNDFYMWYFTLTGIHLLHVVFGTSLLTYLWLKSRRVVYSSTNRVVPECVASYWHLVDLLWIVLFPLLYLMKAV